MDWQIYLEKAKGNLKVAQLALDAGEYDIIGAKLAGRELIIQRR